MRGIRPSRRVPNTHVRMLACVLIAAALPAAAQDVRRELPLPRVSGFELLKADLHLHSIFSDGEVWPTVHVREAWRDGLDVVALSEHREYRPHASHVTGGSGAAHATAAPLADDLGVLLVPAAEITRPVPNQPSAWPVGSAHFNALFVTDDEPLGDGDLRVALQAARSQGAFVFWNHPGFMGRPAEWFEHVDEVFRRGLFGGIEVVNGDDVFPEAFRWALERKLAILACSDAHLPMPAHLHSARRPVTILFARARTLEGVRDALVSRRTVAWLDRDLWGEEEWLRALWAGAIGSRLVADGRPGGAVSVAVHNPTALDFDVEILSAPAWLSLSGARLERFATTLLRGKLDAAAPRGVHEVQVPVGIRNLHTAPDRTLSDGLKIAVRIE